MIYYLLSKDDFSILYKYGEVSIKTGAVAKSDDPRDAVKALFDNSDSFEYAQERLIVACKTGSLSAIKMLNVKTIYPLDQVSKNLFESQFNHSIIFGEPIFQDIADNYLKTVVMKRTTVAGINGLRALFGIAEETDSSLVDDIILGKTFLRKYRKYYDVPFDERTPFSMLIAYNRYQHYPRDTRGYFFDSADCFMYGYMYKSLQEKGCMLVGYDRDLVAQLCESFFNLLETLPATSGFADILQRIDEEKPKINDSIARAYGSIRLIALYFYVKDKVVAENSLTMKGVSLLYSIWKKYPDDFSKLLTLVGGFLGYTWIYDRFYEFKECEFLTEHHSLKELEQTIQRGSPINDVCPIPESQKPSLVGLEVVASKDEPVTSEVQEDMATPALLSTVAVQESILDDAPNLKSIGVSTTIPLGNKFLISEKKIWSDKKDPDDIGMKEQDMQAPRLDLDVSGVLKAVFPRSCPRKEEFGKQLEIFKDTVMNLAFNKDETGLRGIFMKIDPAFNSKKDAKRQEAFVQACLNCITQRLL